MCYRTLPLASKFVEGLPEIQTKHDRIYKGSAKGNTIDDAVVIGVIGEQEGGLYKLKGQPEQALVHESV